MLAHIGTVRLQICINTWTMRNAHTLSERIWSLKCAENNRWHITKCVYIKMVENHKSVKAESNKWYGIWISSRRNSRVMFWFVFFTFWWQLKSMRKGRNEDGAKSWTRINWEFMAFLARWNWFLVIRLRHVLVYIDSFKSIFSGCCIIVLRIFAIANMQKQQQF